MHTRRRPAHAIFVLLASVAIAALFASPASAGKKPKTLKAVKDYPGMTTFKCHTNPIDIYPGQNTNDFTVTQTCPNAVKVGGGPVDPSVFAANSTTQGYVTRFKPSMVEVHDDGSTTVPPVWDLHLHHVVWLSPGGFNPTFAAGEEKSIPKFPRGYGLQVAGGANWGINQMLHELNSREGRQVEITWEIDWVPIDAGLKPINIQWMDVAGAPHVYPVFDAEKAFDTNGDGEYTFPDEVPTDPSVPGYEERQNISPARRWVVGPNGATLVFGVGHLHPGGKRVNMQVARDGADAGTVAGDTPSEIKPLFESDAHYYEPAGAVSWDVSMTATPRKWRISLKPGDVVSINVTYNVKRGDWYESMGILPVAWSTADDPKARDPFDDAKEVKAMVDKGGILTHGRLKENIDSQAGKDLKLPDPRDLKPSGPVPDDGVNIENFLYTPGGFSATKGFPEELMRPVTVDPGDTVTFVNQDALFGETNQQQVWHSVTSCKEPCNAGSGIGYPLASGPVRFDSGQLGYGKGLGNSEVTTGSNIYTTPPLTQAGKTYTYFCRIHPFMRGSIRVRG